MAQSLSLEQICRHVLTLFQWKIERFVVIEISSIQVRVRRLVHSNEEAIRDSKLRRKRLFFLQIPLHVVPWRERKREKDPGNARQKIIPLSTNRLASTRPFFHWTLNSLPIFKRGRRRPHSIKIILEETHTTLVQKWPKLTKEVWAGVGRLSARRGVSEGTGRLSIYRQPVPTVLLRPHGNGSRSTIHITEGAGRQDDRLLAGQDLREEGCSIGGWWWVGRRGPSWNKLSATSNPWAKWTVLKREHLTPLSSARRRRWNSG